MAQCRHGGGKRLDITVCQDLQIVWIHHLFSGLGIGETFVLQACQFVTGILDFPQTVIETYLCLLGIVAAHPVQGFPLDLTVSTRLSAASLGIIGAVDGRNTSFGILVAGMFLVALNDVGILQAHLLARGQTHKFLLGLFLEIIALNPDLTSKLYLMGTIGLVLGVVDGCEGLRLSFGIVGDDHLHRIKDSRHTDGTTVQIVANHTLQKGHVVQGIDLRIANLIDEFHDTLWRIASATETADGRHAGIIPATDDAIFHQSLEVSLRQEDVVQVQFVELRLTGTLVS